MGSCIAVIRHLNKYRWFLEDQALCVLCSTMLSEWPRIERYVVLPLICILLFSNSSFSCKCVLFVLAFVGWVSDAKQCALASLALITQNKVEFNLAANTSLPQQRLEWPTIVKRRLLPQHCDTGVDRNV
jgi:hypothetical protein